MKINLFRTLMISSLVAGSTFLASCDEEAGIEINLPQTQTVLYSIPPVTNTVLSKVDTLDSNLDSLLAANDAEASDITNIALDALSLEFTDKFGVKDASKNFNNVKSVGLNIAELSGAYTNIQSIDSTTMANSYRNINPISFPQMSTNPNLLPYVSKPKFRVQLDGQLFAPTTDTLYIKSVMTFQITVTI